MYGSLRCLYRACRKAEDTAAEEEVIAVFDACGLAPVAAVRRPDGTRRFYADVKGTCKGKPEAPSDISPRDATLDRHTNELCMILCKDPCLDAPGYVGMRALADVVMDNRSSEQAQISIELNTPLCERSHTFFGGVASLIQRFLSSASDAATAEARWW